MKKIKVGVIGVGNMGKNHARVYSEIADLVAISDTNELLGKNVAGKYNAAFYPDYKKMLQGKKIEAISVVVPTYLHKEVVLECLKNSIHTLVEKPIAHNLFDARKMLGWIDKYQTTLMVGHIERFNPAVVKLKKIIDQGRLGKIINLLAIRVGISPPNIHASDVALDLGIHDVDVFNYLLGKFPDRKKVIKTKLFSRSSADASTLLLEYGSITGMIQTNWVTPIKIRKLFVSGVEGYAELDYIQQKIILHDKILHAKFDGSYYQLISLADVPKKEIFISKKEPLKEELKFFLRNRENLNLSNASDAIEALKIVF